MCSSSLHSTACLHRHPIAEHRHRPENDSATAWGLDWTGRLRRSYLSLDSDVFKVMTRTAQDSLPHANTMPSTLPCRPSHTLIMTPDVSTRRAPNSLLVGVLPSMPTARRAVATGMADLQTWGLALVRVLGRLPISQY